MRESKKGIGILIGVLVVIALLLLATILMLNVPVENGAVTEDVWIEAASDWTEEEIEDWSEEPEKGQSRPAVETETEDTEAAWSVDRLKAGLKTAIQYDRQYKAYISSKEEAEQKIREYGIKQREDYSNPAVVQIEKQMEQDYGLFAVNLGEVDIETAEDVERAFAYMYQEYPVLRGTLTDVSLGNLTDFVTSKIAVTTSNEFIINGEFGVCPHVVKYEIILGASTFLNRDNFLKKCEQMTASGYWPENTDISSVVVHELGHQLLGAYSMQRFGLKDPYYITEENEDAYSAYMTDLLSTNQEIPKQVLNEAYVRWEKDHSGEDYMAFCREISEYAAGVQEDGGISYTETFAEAMADVYLNGDRASDAGKKIDEVIRENVR